MYNEIKTALELCSTAAVFQRVCRGAAHDASLMYAFWNQQNVISNERNIAVFCSSKYVVLAGDSGGGGSLRNTGGVSGGGGGMQRAALL
jgi:uncharacterized membrane protein YgcG